MNVEVGLKEERWDVLALGNSGVAGDLHRHCSDPCLPLMRLFPSLPPCPPLPSPPSPLWPLSPEFGGSFAESGVAVSLLPGSDPHCHVSPEQQQSVPRIFQKPSEGIPAQGAACFPLHRRPHAVPLHKGEDLRGGEGCRGPSRHWSWPGFPGQHLSTWLSAAVKVRAVAP